MHVTIDIQAALGESRDRGIGKYSLELLEALAGLDAINISCAGNASRESFLYSGHLSRIPREKFLGYQLPESHSMDARQLHLMQSEALRRFYTGLDTDVIHISSLYETLPQFIAWGPQLLNGDFSHLSDTVVSATFYDAIPSIYPNHYLPTPTLRMLNEAAEKVYSKLDLIFAISESARRDAITHFHISPEQVVNIGSAAGDFYCKLPVKNPLLNKMREKINPDHKKVIFYTGFGDFRKNHAGLLKAFDQLPQHLLDNTILVFSAFFPDEQKNVLLASCNHISHEQVTFTGWLTNEELRALYNLADLFVFPSLYEGFGLPVLEAMKCGTPVIISNTSSLPEVFDLPEAQFDPQNTAQMTDRIIQGLTNQPFRKKLVRYGLERQKIFTWKKVAETAVAAWTNTLTEKKKRSTKIFAPLFKPNGETETSVKKLVQQTAASLNLEDIPFYEFNFPNSRQKTELAAMKKPGILFLTCETGHPVKEDIYSHRLLFTQKFILVESEEIRQSLYRYLPNHANNRIQVLPDDVATRLHVLSQTVEQFAKCRALLDPRKFKNLFKESDEPTLSAALFHTNPNPVKRRILVDLTSFYKTNNRSGIQRVVRQITEHLLADHAEWEIVPFALTLSGYYPLNYQNDKFTRVSSPLTVAKYDLLLMLDSSWDEIGGLEALFNTVKQNEGTIFFMVYDLIPLLLGETCHPAMPFAFEKWFRTAVLYADQLICISKTVADQCAEYVKEHDLLSPEQVLYIDSFILGADIPIVKEENDVRDEAVQIFATPSPLRFLTVGTIEARKNHVAALQVFSALWEDGKDFSWYILGKHGWRTEAFDEMLAQKKDEIGKHIFICDNPSDAEIQYAYNRADALIFPSLGEGFGLPLVEASYFGLPILCSDLAVFHEICGDNAFYFDVKSSLTMYSQISKWIQCGDKRKNHTPIWPYTWKDSTDDLLRSITGRNPRYVIKKGGTAYMELHHNF